MQLRRAAVQKALDHESASLLDFRKRQGAIDLLSVAAGDHAPTFLQLQTTLGFAFDRAWLCGSRDEKGIREPQEVPALAEECVGLCNEYGILQFRVWVACWLGWALAKLGNHKEGIAKIRAGMAAEQASGSAIGYTQFCVLLAEELMDAGKTEEA